MDIFLIIDVSHPQTGGPQAFKNTGASHKEQTSKQHSSVASASVNALKFLPLVPALISLS